MFDEEDDWMDTFQREKDRALQETMLKRQVTQKLKNDIEKRLEQQKGEQTK